MQVVAVRENNILFTQKGAKDVSSTFIPNFLCSAKERYQTRFGIKRALKKSTVERVDRSGVKTLKGEPLVSNSRRIWSTILPASVSADLQGQGHSRVGGWVVRGFPRPTIRKLCRDSMDFAKSRGGWGVAPRGNRKQSVRT